MILPTPPILQFETQAFHRMLIFPQTILALFKRAVVPCPTFDPPFMHPSIHPSTSPSLLFSFLFLEGVRYFRREHSILPIGNGGALIPKMASLDLEFFIGEKATKVEKKAKGDRAETDFVWDRIRIPRKNESVSGTNCPFPL